VVVGGRLDYASLEKKYTETCSISKHPGRALRLFHFPLIALQGKTLNWFWKELVLLQHGRWIRGILTGVKYVDNDSAGALTLLKIRVKWLCLLSWEWNGTTKPCSQFNGNKGECVVGTKWKFKQNEGRVDPGINGMEIMNEGIMEWNGMDDLFKKINIITQVLF